jgi:hypothetical protein
MKLKEIGAQDNCIIAGDFNKTLHQGEKNGGTSIRDQFWEHMEDLISDLDLFNVQPSKGKYTWSNKRSGVEHITARLDHFLIHNPLLFHFLSISYQVVS